jgi:hypothetical protein
MSNTALRHICRLIQLCFGKTIDKLRDGGFQADADALEAATVYRRSS